MLLMDVRMPTVDGLEATRRITSPGGDGVRVLMLTTFKSRIATWVVVPDDGSGAITYRLRAAPAGGWIVGSAGFDC